MNRTRWYRRASCSGLFLAIVSLGAACFAQSQGPEQTAQASLAPASGSESEAAPPTELASALGDRKSPNEADEFSESRLGLSLLKNIALDEKAIWTSPAHVRLGDATWLLPAAGIAAASFASDTHISTGLSRYTTLAKKATHFRTPDFLRLQA